MKIARNGCYGGFGLSFDAVLEILRRKGKSFRIMKGWKNPIDVTGKYESNMFDTYDCYIVADGQTYTQYSFSGDDKRTDPELISVIEDWGVAANGSCSKLEVVEIPDDVNWKISDYDGLETIEEVHRSW